MGFILRRLVFYFGAFLVAVVINFFLPRMMPGDPVDAMLAQGARFTAEQIANLRLTFGVDQPLYQQFFTYLGDVFTLELGHSTFFSNMPVSEVLANAFGWTLFLTGTATILAFMFGATLGIVAAWYRGGKFDSIASPLSLVLQATPQLVFGIVVLFSLGVTWDLIPISYAYDPELTPDFTSWEFLKNVLLHAVGPIFCIFIVQLGGFLVPMRNNMINLLNEDYITMGKAKGLSNIRVMLNYGARNAILPSVTALSMALGFVVGGALVVEVIFNYQGLGSVLFNAIVNRDYQLIQGQLLIMTVFMLAFNFLADVLYVFLDPRLRKGGK
ncbi:ABC transporter permease [Motilimonas sp. E26]|uniref:ABC transporter permease n=1 Tax=Motilimonas sp. E26 TaxID=2865674 RepID=UPI001E35C903|nr:ABC transporter permease [Motilimonas sp. E26]MCE0558830.1 ABC transporter permease [Motilimonas sp. E26]